MAHTRQTHNPLAPAAAPANPEGESQEKVIAATVTATNPPVERLPGVKRFRLEKSNGEADVIEAATVEDAIRQLNSDARGKVFTYKSLKITEI